MRTGWREPAFLVALLLLTIAPTVAAAGRRGDAAEKSFGRHRHVIVDLPQAPAQSTFSAIAPTAGDGTLAVYVLYPDRETYSSVIERRMADGALDRSFGDDGSVRIGLPVTALAEDAAGGVVYGSYGTLGRLTPSGSRDKAFDARVGRIYDEFDPATIAFDQAGRIVVGGSVAQGARYHPHLGAAGVLRFDPDGRRDRSFNGGATVYLGEYEGHSGELAVLPDGSILVLGPAVTHLATDGSVLPTPTVEAKTIVGRPGLAVFADGSFAVSAASYSRPGCAITRYDAGGSPDASFGHEGLYSDPDLAECRIAATPDGDLLVRGTFRSGKKKGATEVSLLDSSGSPVTGFGRDGSVTVHPPAGATDPGHLTISGVTSTAGGEVILAGGTGDGFLLKLKASGSRDASFGKGGSLVQRASLPSWTSPRAITAEADGELVVAGLTDAGRYGRHPFLMRFGADGRLLRTPSGAPFASVSNPSNELQPAADGRVFSLIPGPAIAEYKAGGAPFRTFGGDGIASLPEGFHASSFVVDGGGGVTVFGSLEGSRLAAVRLTARGRPDSTFGGDGLATLRVPGATHVTARAGVPLPGGAVILLGAAEQHLTVGELGADGRPRRGFGHRGLFDCRCGGVRPEDVKAVLHRGFVYALTHSATARGESIDLIKVGLDGSLDRSFAGRGYRPVKVTNAIDLFARGEQILVLGQDGYGHGPSQVRAFRLDGATDGSFPNAPTVEAGGNQGIARLSGVLQPGGRLVIAGERRAKQEIDGSSLELVGIG